MLKCKKTTGFTSAFVTTDRGYLDHLLVRGIVPEAQMEQRSRGRRGGGGAVSAVSGCRDLFAAVVVIVTFPCLKDIGSVGKERKRDSEWKERRGQGRNEVTWFAPATQVTE